MVNLGLEHSQIKLSRSYASYYKKWLLSYISLIFANLLAHNFVIGKLYTADLNKILRSPNAPVAHALELNFLSYAIVTAVIVFFVSRALPKKHAVPMGVLYGMLLGTIVFLPHTLTNYVMFKEWSVAIILIDICWGILQGAIVGLITATMHK